MKIYTRTGDQGETALLGGTRVAKDHGRIEAYGTVDELNASLGVVRAQLATENDPEDINGLLGKIQHQLFDLGAELAAPEPEKMRTPLVADDQVASLEAAIDHFEANLAPLRQFILPGGSLSGAQLHVARCICRRAERRLVALGHHEPLREVPVQYLNRLADLLFVLSRAANQAAGIADVPWEKTE